MTTGRMVRCRTAISETLRHRSSFHPRQRRGILEDLAVGLAQTPKSTDRWLRDRTTLMLPRAFCELLLTDDVVVDDTEAHHLLHVLRLKSGDPLQLFNGCGMEVDAVVTRSSRARGFLYRASPSSDVSHESCSRHGDCCATQGRPPKMDGRKAN